MPNDKYDYYKLHDDGTLEPDGVLRHNHFSAPYWFLAATIRAAAT